ncbi:caspase family protein [Streptomyces sp. NPDC048751]|uniref:HD domain-containing protein n=1 Tax=Streptomyces sp. NPDC048751 TaxID=3365591 RepID=UPI0037122B34
MEQVRRALLIGVGRAPGTAELLEPLDEVVKADLRLIGSVLDAAGYEVEVVHDAGLSRIKAEIYEAASDVPEDGTLLLYFTGHGIRVGGTDYLVPADASPPRDGVWREPYVDSLLPANISPLLKECAARTVLWLIDACRTDLGDDSVAFGNSIDNGPPQGGFAVLTACSAGQRSGYTPEGSFFTRGLADALGPLTPARTVDEVFAAARARTAAAALRHGLTQTAVIRYGTNAEAETREVEICEGRPLLETWLRAALETPLWERVRPEDQPHVPFFKENLGAFVERCARTLHLAQNRLPRPDPWSDETFPARLVRHRLPLLLPASEPLSAVEVVFLVAAPFLREVAWADRMSQAVEIDPYCPRRRPGADAHRRHYEQIGDEHARIVRKADQCRARGRVEDETAVTMWLVHRWIADRVETDDEPAPTAPAQALLAALGVAQDRVREVAELLCSAASGIGLGEPSDALSGRVPGKVVLPDGHQPLRVRPLAALLRLAAVLTVDVRTFPEIVAEHLAVTDPVLPEHVVGVARGLSWEREDAALHLDAPCPHQAVHAALAEIVDEADQLAAQVLDLAAELRGPEAALLTAVPRRITDRDLRPARTGSRERYEVPLQRFHLAQSEVRELLMGEQLYGGEPHLALRELYQNAMDACRYRAMRWAYLRSSGTRPADWSGRITFSQGEDERGRYVECRDNGVGMSTEMLTHTFTRAGSRFERSKAFRREQSRWLRHDRSLRLYPNSRFGIGVFSYFMLADEMTIVTRQVSPEGIPAEHALRVDIPSSGSLFRVQRHDGPDDGLAEGGTRVRLYLREGPATADLSCTRVLRELVRVSEFEVEARDEEGWEHRWRTGELQPPPGRSEYASLVGVPGVLWWVNGEGAVLCDGIMTDQEPYGYVLNLTGPHAGKLSVSRKELQDFDRGWAEEQWRLGAGALAKWPELTLPWTAELERRSLRVAQVLDEEWRGTGVVLAGEKRGQLPLDSVGWFHLDHGVRFHDLKAKWLWPWRSAVLGRSVGYMPSVPPRSTDGYPVPAPGDADLAVERAPSWRAVVSYAAQHRLVLSDLLRRQRQLRILHPSYAPPATSGGDLDWVPDALDGSLARALSGDPQAAGNRRERTAVSEGRIDDLGGLVLASQRLGVPLGRLARSLARCAPLHSLTVPSAPEHHMDHVCTEDDVHCLFVPADNYRDVHRVKSPQDVLDVCRRTGTPVEEVLGRLARFGWLGWTAPSPDEVAPWMELTDEFGELVRAFTAAGPDGRPRLGWAATIWAAGVFEVPLAEAERRLAEKATELGLAYERRCADGRSDGTLVPSRAVADDLGRLVRELDGPLENGLDLTDLYFAGAFGWASDDTFKVLRDTGFPLPADDWIARRYSTLGLRDRYVLSGKDAAVDDHDYPAGVLTSAVLFTAARYLTESLGEVWALAAGYAPSSGDTIPPLPKSLTGYHPFEDVCDVLCETDDRHSDGGTPHWCPVTPVALARYSKRRDLTPAAAYERLAAFRVIGALVQELSAEEVAELPDGVPDDWDLVALSPDHRVSAADSPYTPLDLVGIAARLGEPVSETVRRISPYLPLCPTSGDLPPAPDTIPCWQDLILLTQHFDGRLPAVQGRVTARHIRLAAEATGESEAWIRTRLRLYATLFGLEIDESETDPHD